MVSWTPGPVSSKNVRMGFMLAVYSASPAWGVAQHACVVQNLARSAADLPPAMQQAWAVHPASLLVLVNPRVCWFLSFRGLQAQPQHCQEAGHAGRTCGIIFWMALRVWCMDMISSPNFSVLNAQKSTTCRHTAVGQCKQAAGLRAALAWLQLT